jgi:peptidoglycan/xylan/chitin deacetylase (PgdA/CDA1 family)
MAASALGAIVLVVVVVPYVCVKHLGWGILRRGRGPSGAIALTFDDGPDPHFTPRVLEILAAHGVKATFFLKGESADRHPEWVHRLVAAGHEVGSHGYRHRHALFHRPPLAGYFDTLKGVARLEALLGRRTRFFRPPWGAYSWSVLLGILRARVQPVNWTVEAHDWHPRYSPERVVQRVLAEVRPGAIVVMHDGGRGGPKTIHALEGVLRGLPVRGLRALPLSMLAPRSGVFGRSPLGEEVP